MAKEIHGGKLWFLFLAVVMAAAGHGDVRLTGPIGERLDRMIANHVKATDVDRLVAPFREKSERRNWWQTEFWGKYMHAAVPYCLYTGDAALKAKVDAGVTELLKTQEACGYIGNYPDELRCGEGWDVWGMKYTMMGLLHYWDAFRDERALAAAKRVCDYLIAELGPDGRRGRAVWQTGNWSGLASSSVLEPVVWLYRRTDEKRYLDFAAFIVKGMEEPADGPRLVDLALKGIPVADRNGHGNVAEKNGSYVMKRSRRKAYEMMSCYQGLVDYSEETGRADLLEAAVRAAESIVRDEINVAGGCTSSEAWYHGAERQHLPYAFQQETCVLTTWMRLAGRLLAATGDPRWGDELERTFYNAYFAAMNRSGSEFAAYTPLDGARHSGHHHCYLHTNCCNANGPRGFLAFLRALLTAKDDTATMNFYASGTSRVKLPKSGREVAFETYTLYPKQGYVRLANHTTAPGAFTLALRIPAWSAKTRVRVNGAEVGGDVAAGRYFELKRDWRLGDVVEIDFDLAVKMHRLSNHVAFTRGPIALARDTRFADGPLDEPWRSDCQEKAPDFTLVRSPGDDFWMTFSAVAPVAYHRENPEGGLGRAVRFCDYASAADLWRPDNACRVWIPVERWP